MPTYHFVEWRDELGNVWTTPSISVLIDKDKTLTAYYEEIIVPTHILTVQTTVGGSTDPLPGSYEYDEGLTARVRAIPDSGYEFDYWLLDGATRTENPIDVTMNIDHTLTAYFKALPPPTYTLTIGTTIGGTTDPTPGSYTYDEGMTATVTAIANAGYAFDYWDLDGTVYAPNPINVLMDNDHSLIAYFVETAPPIYNLTISTGVGGTTDPLPGIYPFEEGTIVTVTATPISGYKFENWNLDGAVRTENPISLTMDANHALHAHFSEIGPPPPAPCWIATASFGTSVAPELHTLRRFRNGCLPKKLVDFYYATSPRIAQYIRTHRNVRSTVKSLLEIVVKAVKKLIDG